MTDIPKIPFTPLDASIRKVVSAHTAVTQGIATHAEKEHARRQAHHAKMHSETPLRVPLDEHNTSM